MRYMANIRAACHVHRYNCTALILWFVLPDNRTACTAPTEASSSTPPAWWAVGASTWIRPLTAKAPDAGSSRPSPLTHPCA